MNILAGVSALCVACVLQMCWLFTQQPAPSRVTPESPNTAVVRGRVLAAETQAPLQGARVTLTDRRDQQFVAITDDKGEFEIGSLRAGGYTVLAVLQGRVSGGHEPSPGNLPGSSLELIEGEVVDGLQVELPRVAVITGVFSDENDKPVSGMTIATMRPRVDYAGLDIDPISGLAENMYIKTDPDGRFRLDRLAPGTYYLAAFPTGHGRIFAGRNRFDDLPTTFFPGTYNPHDAQTISVSAGEEKVVNFSVSRTQLPQLAGRVFDGSAPSVGASVILSNLTSRAPLERPVVRRLAATASDGAFRLTDVPAGAYKILAVTRGGADGSARQAMLHLTVGSRDVSDLTLVTSPGGVLSGRITYDTNAPVAVSAKDLFVTATLAAPVVFSAVRAERATINPDGTFVIRRIYGEQFVRAGTFLRREYCVRRIQHNGQDITDTPIDFDRTPLVQDVTIEMTSRCAHLRGVVTDSRGRRASRVGVVAYARDPAKLYYESRFDRTTQTNDSGEYQFYDLPPDTEYFVVAGRYVAGSYSEDPKNRSQISNLASTIVVGGGETATLDLRVVRWP